MMSFILYWIPPTNHQMSDDADDGYFDKVDFVKLIREGLIYFWENCC